MRARARFAPRRRGAWPAGLLLLAGACSGSGPEPVLRLAAAASLSDVLPQVLAERDPAAVQVQAVYGGSGELAAELRHGAAFDAVLLADQRLVASLAANGWLLAGSTREPFANRLQFVTADAAAEPAEGLAAAWPDFAGRRIALGSDGVPVGDAARRWLARAGVDPEAAVLVPMPNVRAVAAAVGSGACAAGFVYRTDVAAHPELHVQAADPATVVYGAGVAAASPWPAEAAALLASVEAAAATWSRAGFLPVEGGAGPEPAVAAVPRDFLSILWRTLWIGLAAVLLELPFALALGRLLARREFAGKAVLRALFTLPMFLPPVAVGLFLLLLLAPRGPLGGFGSEWLYGPPAAVLAAAIVSFPLLLRHAEEALAAVPARLVQVSRSLGVGAWGTFLRVELPLARRGLAAGVLLAFARGVAEFGATAVVAGTVPGSTETLATGLHRRLLSGDDPGALALAGLSVLLGLCAVVASELLRRKPRSHGRD
ncbi:MAG TPA: substrate-binding domain-containing protein [Planctomycetota bacterium]